MKFLLLLSAVIGVSLGLRKDFEDTYRYRGRVASGIPSISSQVAASAFYCDAKVQFMDNMELRIQFSNIFIGDMNDKVTCEDQIEYLPMSQFKDQLEKPFGAKMFDNDQDKPFQFPDDDDLWMRNFRRAFVHLLHIPTKARLPSMNNEEPGITQSFTRTILEDSPKSPLGDCAATYTWTPIKEHQKYYLPDPLEKDSEENLENSYWRLSKSVDFDHCGDVLPSDTHASTSFYVFKGNLQNLRLEKAVQEGTYIVDHDHAHTYTNNTLDLRSVDPIGTPFDVSGSFYSLRHEVDSLNLEIKKYYGIKGPTEDSGINFQIYAKKQLLSASSDLNNGHPFHFAEDMEALSVAVDLLSKNDLEGLYMSLAGDTRSLFLKILSASGLETPYLFLMEKLFDGDLSDEILSGNQLDFLLNAVQNTKNHKLIKPMMDRVMNFKSSDFLSSLAVVNFPSLATRVCFQPCGRDKHGGEINCRMDLCEKLVDNTYLPWLDQRLNDESNTLWESMVFMMAIYNYNSVKIIPIIRPYVIGVKDVDVRLRVSAIYALRKDDMPYSTKTEILQMLMAVFDNYQEHYRVREAAFSVMLHWDPEPSWWHYMALNTWRDPSNNVVSLVSNTIYSFKK
ncbi:unnamed protein product, partial [Meganyctiphanes norvegica]